MNSDELTIYPFEDVISHVENYIGTIKVYFFFKYQNIRFIGIKYHVNGLRTYTNIDIANFE